MSNTYRSRCRLHINKLAEFTQFCEEHGWVKQQTKQQTKSIYEELRMVHPGASGPLLVYKKDKAKEHLTTYGHSEDMTRAFLAEPPRPVPAPTPVLTPSAPAFATDTPPWD
jgi:hypothetical protein